MSEALVDSSGKLESAGGSSNGGRGGDWERLEVKRYRTDTDYTRTVLNYKYRQPLPDNRERDFASAAIRKLQAELCEHKRYNASVASSLRTFLKEYSPDQLNGVDENDENPNSVEILLRQFLTFQCTGKPANEMEPKKTKTLQDQHSKLNEMATELAEAEMQCDRLAKDNNRLSSVCIQQKELVKRLHSENDSNIQELKLTLKSNLTQTKQEAMEQQQTVSRLNQMIENVQHELGLKQKEIAALQQKLGSDAEESEEKNELIERLAAEIVEQESWLKKSQAKAQSLADQLYAFSQENDQLKNELTEAIDEKNTVEKSAAAKEQTYTNQIQCLLEKNVYTESAMLKLGDEIEKLTAENRQLQDDKKSSEVQLEDLKTQVKQENEAMKESSEACHQHLSELATIKHDFDILQARHCKLEQEKQNLEEVAAALGEQNDQLANTVDKPVEEMETEKVQLETSIQDEKAKNAKLYLEIAEQNQKIEQQKRCLEDMELSVKQTAKKLQCSVDKQNIYKRALSGMEQRALMYKEAAVHDLDTLEMDLKMAEAARSELEEKLETAARELSRCENDRNHLKDNIQDLEKKLQHEADNIATSEETIQTLRTHMDQLLLEKESFIEEKKTWKNTIHRRLEHMEQKLCTPISLTCHVSTLKANVPLSATSFFSQPSAP